MSHFVDVIGHGYPLVLTHGGPSADHWTLVTFRRCADQFTLIFYLTADADALRERLGFERWAVLGHSFGGHVALLVRRWFHGEFEPPEFFRIFLRFRNAYAAEPSL